MNRLLKLALPTLAALAACEGPTEPRAVHVVAVTPATGTLSSGGQLQLAAAPLDVSGSLLAGRTITWLSSNPAVATVSASGLVTAGTVTVGTAEQVTITATTGGVAGTAALTVSPAPVVTVAVVPGAQTLASGGAISLSATLVGAGGVLLQARTIVWSSSDPTVATVSQTGTVTAGTVAGATARTATVSATSEGVVGITTVTVLPVAVASLTLDPLTKTIFRGTSRMFTATVRSAAGVALTGRIVSWSTSDAAIASVSPDGLVAAIANGMVTISATSDGRTATASVSAVSWTQIVSENITTCGRSTAGEAYCWGNGGQGQLGNGNTASSAEPVLVDGNLLFTSLGVSQAHTCGMVATNGAYCWGDNSYGQLGDGTQVPERSLPTPVGGANAFVSIDVNRHANCALTSDGTMYCWGRNFSGRLGDGTQTDRLVPTLVSGGLRFESISVGPAHTCAIALSGESYCWGMNNFGQLGDSTIETTGRFAPTPVKSGLPFVSIVAGYRHTCGLTLSGNAYCWGENDYGQLGTGVVSAQSQLAPVAVAGGITFRSISGGNFRHMCGLSTAGVAYCWGDGLFGQRGDGTTTTAATPVEVAGGLRFTSLETGISRTCGVTTTGSGYCWGTFGNEVQLVPAAVPTPP